MNKDFTKDLVFYEENSETTGHRKKFSYCRGRKSEKEGYYYPLLDMNTFADKPEKIPENAKKIRKPPLSIIRSYIYDPKKLILRKKTFLSTKTTICIQFTIMEVFRSLFMYPKIRQLFPFIENLRCPIF